MNEAILSRRAAGLSAALPTPHFPSELDDGTIIFDSGFASPEVLPDLSAIAAEALRTHRAEVLQYSMGQGQPHLRGWIADYMNADGCGLTPDNLLIVNGAKNGIDLVCRLLLDEGDTIVVTAPTYYTAIPIFRSFGIEFIEIGQDEHGILVDELERVLAERREAGKPPPKFVYDIADFHNPTGATMSAERRRALVALAERSGLFVVEDTPYRRVRFEGEAIPSLKALDTSGAVIHIGTFSKLIAPGLRMGWIAAETPLIARLIQLKSDGGSSPLMQRIVYDFCRSDAFDEHVRRVCAAYGEHRDHMVAAVRRHLPEARLSVPEGGYYVWLTFPGHFDGELFARRAEEVGVHIIAGSKFFVGAGYPANRDAGRNHLRLSYSYAAPAEIDEGLARLGDVYRPAMGRSA